MAAMFDAIALAVHIQDVGMMGSAVEKRASEAFGFEGAGPFIERQV